MNATRAIEAYGVACTPPVWARGGHAQTLFGHLLPSAGARITASGSASRHEIELDDGDRLLAFGLAGTSGVRVHLFHGLSGDANSDYMRRTAAALGARGHGVWVVNHRGCGEGRGMAARPYHSGRSEDMRAVLAASRRDAPDSAYIVIGFSLSGNVALLHAAQHLAPAPDGIIAVNPPVDIGRSSVDMGKGLSRLYQLRFMWRLRREVRERERAGMTRAHYDISLRTSMLAFDDLFTAPECGFENGLDYYRKCSTAGRLHLIETPTVIVTAADDPFVDPAVYADAARSDAVHLHVEPHGGHVGYLTRNGAGWKHWLDAALVHYVDELARR